MDFFHSLYGFDGQPDTMWSSLIIVIPMRYLLCPAHNNYGIRTEVNTLF